MVKMVHVPAGSLDADTATLMLRALISTIDAKNLPEGESKNTFGYEIESAPVLKNVESGRLLREEPCFEKISVFRLAIALKLLGTGAAWTSGGAQVQV